MVSRGDIEDLLGLLRSDRRDARREALDRLRSWRSETLDDDVADALLAGAGETYPEIPGPSIYGANDALVQVLWDSPETVSPETVMRHLPALRDEAFWTAVRLLAYIPTPAASVALARALLRHGPGSPPHWPVLAPLAKAPRDPDVLLPVLVDLLPRWGKSVSGPLLGYATAGLVEPEHQQLISAAVGPPLAQTLSDLRSDYERTGRNVVWDDVDYVDRRVDASQQLDMLGHFRGADLDQILLQAADHPDPWLALWGAVGQHRRGHAPPADAVRRAAADPESRNVLYDAVRDLVPPEYRTQAMLAESDMVRWLLWPSELGRLPDAIELVAAVPTSDDDGPADLYVFRFLDGDQGWLVGVSGPFLRAEQPTTNSRGGTFSMFLRFDDKSVRAHVEEIGGTLAHWTEFHGRGS